jgi:hypothetical protein
MSYRKRIRPKHKLPPRLGNEINVQVFKAVVLRFTPEENKTIIAQEKFDDVRFCTFKIVNKRGREAVEVHLRIEKEKVIDVDFYVPLSEWKKVAELRQTKFVDSKSEAKEGEKVFRVGEH